MELYECLRYAAIYPSQLSRLDLSHCALPADIGESLGRILGQEHCCLTHLDVSFNRLDASSMVPLTEELKRRLTHTHITGASLQVLDLSCNPEVGTPGVVLLAEVFLERRLLTGQLAENVTDAGRLQIRDLHLGGCGIGPEGVCDALAEMSSIYILYLYVA
jgi:hypothetical protein